eukprot:maker-scaffold_132-augustus-gene-0.12-mRNA-1 protein AED:0.53 eAED:0.54 QI:0/0/0/1/0/0/2/0/94
MRDDPNAELKCTSSAQRSHKRVGSSRQQDGGHGSRNPLRRLSSCCEAMPCGVVEWLLLQILVAVASIQMRTLIAVVEKGSMLTAIGHGLVGFKA